LFSRLTELHWNKKRLFQSSAGREQQELSSFIDILSPRQPFHQLAARTSRSVKYANDVTNQCTTGVIHQGKADCSV